MSKKILLIDDEKDFTELTGTLLKFHDFDVETFNDSVEIDAVIRKQRYDLIVTDLMMPGLDGIQLVSNIRSTEGYAETPIIVLSAKNLTDEERKKLFHNQVHFLNKPFEPHGLVDHITKLLSPVPVK